MVSEWSPKSHEEKLIVNSNLQQIRANILLCSFSFIVIVTVIQNGWRKPILQFLDGCSEFSCSKPVQPLDKNLLKSYNTLQTSNIKFNASATTPDWTTGLFNKKKIEKHRNTSAKCSLHPWTYILTSTIGRVSNALNMGKLLSNLDEQQQSVTIHEQHIN